MKNKLIYLSLLSFLTITGCNKNDTKTSSSSLASDESSSLESSSSSDSSSIIEESYSYRLEKNETTPNYLFEALELKDISKCKSSMTIDGISTLYEDPYTYSYFMNEADIKYPTDSLLSGKAIIYTSAWYSRYTFKREETVKEYVLYYSNNNWIVESIENKPETFIPLNGAVLSIPSSINVSYEEGDTVPIENSTIITDYQLSFYNQDNNRISIRYVNENSWGYDEINMYDDNTLTTATRTGNSRLVTINVVYNESNKEYKVDKFRQLTTQGNIFTNISDGGFILVASTDSSNECIKLFDSALFKKDDVIKAEDGGIIHDGKTTLNVGSTGNECYMASGKKVSFTMAKSTSNTSTTSWGNEVAIDKNGYVSATGAHVTIPTGGYKFVLSGINGSSSESLNVYVNETFPLGSKITIASNKAVISTNTTIRANSFWSQVASYAETILDENIAAQNYDYNEEKSLENYQKLLKIKEEIDNLIDSDDATNQYRIYSLIGCIRQIYYNLISYSNRNEAVQAKSCWYITSFSSTDSNLENIQNHLDLIRASGINEIIIYGVDDGTVSYSNSKLLPQTKSCAKNNYGEYEHDFLKAITAEAHKRNMTVQVCFCPFTSGIENVFTELNDCKALNVDGKDQVTTSQGVVKMLDPANDTVQERIKDVVNDILECNPDIDGIHLDYIRYGADNNSINTMMGITTSAMEKYNSTYKTSFSSLDEFRKELKKTSGVFNNFMISLQQFITDTVSNVKDVCKIYDVPLTCAVAADGYTSLKTWKSQAYGKWVEAGVVDALYLMDYYFDEYYIEYNFNDMLSNTNNEVLYITGIDPSYAGLADEYYARTIKGALASEKAAGYAIFGTHTQDVKKAGWDLISDSNWIDSISPYESLEKTIKASSDKLLERCDNIYIKYSNQTASQKESLQKDLEDLQKLITADSYEVATNVVNKLNDMLDKKYASNEANNRIKEQLEYMLKLAKLKQNVYKD